MIGINVTLIYCNNDMFDGLEKVFEPFIAEPFIAVSEDSKILLFQIPPDVATTDHYGRVPLDF